MLSQKRLCWLKAMLGITLVSTSGLPALGADGCAPGTTCLAVNADGTSASEPAPYTAQCSGAFPDFIAASSQAPRGGPWFRLSQNYPQTLPANDATWQAVDFKNGASGANDYLYALRDYAFDGMIAADFRPEGNTVRPWFHMPLMNFGPGPGRREATRGLTGERPVTGPELGIKNGVTIHNYAIGFYNAVGAYTIGQVWKTNSPDLTKAIFSPGAMSFKILFSDASPTDFSSSDLLKGAPQWTIQTANEPKDVRLLQMDVAAADARAPTRWVFGTLAYDSSAPAASPWHRMRPVGLSWGNDYGYTPADQQAGKPLMETTVSDQAPAYARGHLGWAGRMNGPVDNPISGCLSCHATAEFPVAAPLTFGAKCDTDQKKMQWFRNFSGQTSFGAIDNVTCAPVAKSPAPTTLDFSLQFKVSVQNVLQFNMKNPCRPGGPASAVKALEGYQNAPRVER